MNALSKYLGLLAILAATAGSMEAATTVNAGSINVVTGPEDLDLVGEIVYAINFSPNDPPRTVNGVVFTPDTSPPPGATLVGPNDVAGWQTKPEFGDTVSDNELEEIFHDIRWANNGAGQLLEAHLPVTAGETYKLQILISGNHAADDRRWDIEVEGEMVVDEIVSLGESVDGSLPAYDQGQAITFTQTVTVADSFLDIRMGSLGGETEGADRNPIWQGLIVEKVVPDSDGDDLPDAWESSNFGNLSQTGTGDPDSDGLPNVGEYSAGTNPNLADTDGDTLNDGAEVNTHGSNPKVQDTDGDTLRDDAEVNTHNTSPRLADTDSDGLSDAAEINTHTTNPNDFDSDDDNYNDGFEVAQSTNPKSATSFPLLSTMVFFFTGGDAGEGLDLSGNFIQSFNVGTPGAAPGPVGDADFTDDAQPGIVVSAQNEIQNWHAPSYGDSANDDNLEFVMQSIRWSAAPATVNVDVSGLTVGKPYKLQLLFAEQCCAGRGYDIEIEGVVQADDFMPAAAQGGAGNTSRGAVVVHGFIATDDTLNIVLNGNGATLPQINDRNPILNAVTVEEVAGEDADGDGLPDVWELANFGDLNQSGTGDFEPDGLNNQQELARGTNPKVADTDGDGLNDGPEVSTHSTNPLNADTDRDGLSDGAEVNTHSTNPILADTDGDGYPDGSEIANGTNPTNASSYPLVSTVVSGFTGGDPGEGLDLTGTFKYAFNVGTPGAAPGPVGDAPFTDDAQPGIVVTAQNEVPGWHAPNYGDTANDDNLEFVMQSIRWSAAPATVNVDLSDLTPGKAYKVQLLFAEQCCAGRGFDIELDGLLRADDFLITSMQGGAGVTNRGSVVTIGFIASDDTANIVLNGMGATSPQITDRNATLSAVTLEDLNLPDSDGDGLVDAYEIQYFGSIAAQSGASDADSDGRTNLQEAQAGTFPTVADSDGDGLNDGAEATAGTNPLSPDTDRDGLTDSAEISTHGTNPTLADTDGDQFSDLDELIAGSNPVVAGSIPPSTVGTFTGGDAGEGLDLDGTFAYAFNFGGPAAGQVRSANFVADSAAGISWVAPNQIGNWHAPAYGDTLEDDRLEVVMQSIRWNAAPGTVQVNLPNLTPGQRYKLQLLFAEQCCANRGYDIKLEGGAVVKNFLPAVVQEGAGNGAQGAVISYEFVAKDDVLNIVLDGMSATDPAIGDRNPILNGVTLESLAVAAPASLQITSVTATSATFLARGAPGKTYALDYSPSLATASWTEVNDTVVIGQDGTATTSDTAPAHFAPVQGFWRLRDPAQRPNP
jgi:hypothetical protein